MNVIKLTRTHKIIIASVFAVLALLIILRVNYVINEQRTVLKEDLTMKEYPIELYVEEDIKPGKYEPESGIYTGAYVDKDDNISGDLLKYEKLTGQKQTFKVFVYDKQKGIGRQDILRCIAQKKTPYIKLMLGSDYDLTPLYQLIFDIRDNYNIPVFVELYPLTDKNYSISDYKEIYQRAYEILHKYLSDIVVVWSANETRVKDMAVYYPGADYTDWVGINVFIPRYKGDDPYLYEGTKNLDYWYKTYQNKKPLMISSLAISNYSNVDHAYSINEVENHLDLFYGRVLGEYPRIKGIIYMDVDMTKVSNKSSEDYRLTLQPSLLEKMNQLSSQLNIMSSLGQKHGDIPCYMKYSIMGINYNDELYISGDYISSCFKDLSLKNISHIEDLSGEVFYSYSDIQKQYNTYYRD